MGAASSAVGVVGGIAQTVIGSKQASNARKAIDNYQRQEIKNPYENLKVATVGAKLQQDMATAATATSMAALRSGGTRSLIGGVGQVQAQNVAMSRGIAAGLDQQIVQNEQMKAQGESMKQQMIEQRERDDLTGLGQQMASGQQTMMSGLANTAGAIGAAGRMAQMNKMMNNMPQGSNVNFNV